MCRSSHQMVASNPRMKRSPARFSRVKPPRKSAMPRGSVRGGRGAGHRSCIGSTDPDEFSPPPVPG